MIKKAHVPAIITGTCALVISCSFRQHRTIPALRQAPLRQLRHGICVAKMLDNVGLRYPHRASGQKPLALCDRCPCFGSLFPPLAALTFAASSIICAFGLASAAPRSPYRHLELCGIAFVFPALCLGVLSLFSDAQSGVSPDPLVPESAGASGAGASVAVGSWVGSCVAALGSCAPQRVQ